MSVENEILPADSVCPFKGSSLHAMIKERPEERNLLAKLCILKTDEECLLMLRTRLFTLAEQGADDRTLERAFSLVEAAMVRTHGTLTSHWQTRQAAVIDLVTQLYAENPSLDNCEELAKHLGPVLVDCWTYADTLEQASNCLRAIVTACTSVRLTKHVANAMRHAKLSADPVVQFGLLFDWRNIFDGQQRQACFAFMNALRHALVNDIDNATFIRLMRLTPCARGLAAGDFAEAERYAKLVDMRAHALMRFMKVFSHALDRATNDMDGKHAAILGGCGLTVDITISDGSSLTVDLTITANTLLSRQVELQLVCWACAWVKDQTADGPLVLLRECREEAGLPASSDDKVVIGLTVPGKMSMNLAPS